jgi:hypothetical protein
LKIEMYVALEHVILPCTALPDMPISAISMLRIVSTVLSLLLGFGLKFSRRPKLAKLFINRLVFFEPRNNHLNKVESVCHVKTKSEH